MSIKNIFIFFQGISRARSVFIRPILHFGRQRSVGSPRRSPYKCVFTFSKLWLLSGNRLNHGNSKASQHLYSERTTLDLERKESRSLGKIARGVIENFFAVLCVNFSESCSQQFIGNITRVRNSASANNSKHFWPTFEQTEYTHNS